MLLTVLATQNVPKTRLSIPSVALNLFAALVFCQSSYLEHTRSVRPSTVLTLCLLFSLLFDVARARTLWAMYDNALAAGLLTATVPVKFCILLLESRGKQNLIEPSEKAYPPEARSGIISRSLFWWLNPLFFRGFREALSVEKLFDVDKYLGAEWAGEKLQTAWENLTGRCSLSFFVVDECCALTAETAATQQIPQSSNALAYLLLRQFKWQLSAAVIPRLILTGFTFCQPFAASRLIDYISSDDPHQTQAMGYGLVGAFAIIYIGIAVSPSSQRAKYSALLIG